MSNVVIKRFRDKHSKKVYTKGDSYEHKDAERIAFLVDQGYLQETKSPGDGDDQFPKHSGGSWYELSNGEKIQGKEEAAAAQKELADRGE